MTRGIRQATPLRDTSGHLGSSALIAGWGCSPPAVAVECLSCCYNVWRGEQQPALHSGNGKEPRWVAVLAPHCGAGICSATWLSKPGKESPPSVRCRALCNCLHCWMIMNPRGMCYHLNISEVQAEHVIAAPRRRGAEC